MKKQPTPTEMELAAEAELAILQRHYRDLENERNAFFSGALAGSKARVIEVLKEESKDLDLTLAVANSTQNQRKDEYVSEKLTDLLERYDRYDNDIRCGRTEISELEDQIKQVQRQIIAMSKYQVTDAQYQKKIDNTAKAVTKFENQLDTEIKKFNNVMADNTVLRREIQHMLLQRAQFNRLWNHLVRNLTRGKRFMLDLIEQATMAYDQREELCQKLEALKRRGAQDLAMHTWEMRQLQRKLNHGSKLQEYLGVKGQRRILLDLEQRDEAKRKYEIESKQNQLNQYRELLRRITVFCGEEDIDRLAIQFKKQEADNFSLFSYVTEMNRQVDGITDKILKLKSEVDGEREITAWRKEHEAQRLLELEAKFDETKEAADKEEEQMLEYQERLETLLNGVKEIFTMIETDDAPIMRLLGDTTEVTLNNVILYLKLIERRTNEIMQMVYFTENRGMEMYGLMPFRDLRSRDSEEYGEEEYEGDEYEGDEYEGDEYEDQEYKAIEDESAEAIQDLGASVEGKLSEEEQIPKEGEDKETTILKEVDIGSSTELLRVTYGEEMEPKEKIIREIIRPRIRPQPIDILLYTQPCPLCVEAEEIDLTRLEEDVAPYTREEVKEKLKERMLLPDISNRLHNVSLCKLPGSRKILQRRFQTS